MIQTTITTRVPRVRPAKRQNPTFPTESIKSGLTQVSGRLLPDKVKGCATLHVVAPTLRIGIMTIRILPAPVVTMLASRNHRLRHYLWHAIRGAWNNPGLKKEVRQFIKDKKWAPPDDRVPFDQYGHLILDNNSGEDFLFMHRQMISEVNQVLAQLGEPPLQPWSGIPAPGQAPEFAVPPAWTYADPRNSDSRNASMTERLKRVKSDDYYSNPLGIWEAFYTTPSNLASLSLGALGNMLEMTIHNNLHMRWASEPIGYMPSPNLEDTANIDSKWDDPKHDFLGNFYSSHVNPVFWYLHGWVDHCIDLWAEANKVEDIQWKGTWQGKLEDGWTPDQPKMFTRSIRLEAMTQHKLPASFFGLSPGMELGDTGGHGGHGGHGDNDIGEMEEMEEIVRMLGSCKVIRNFYDILSETN